MAFSSPILYFSSKSPQIFSWVQKPNGAGSQSKNMNLLLYNPDPRMKWEHWVKCITDTNFDGVSTGLKPKLIA